MTMTTEERINLVQEAQEELQSAISKLREAVHGHWSESNTKAYLIDHLAIMASEDHGFLSRDLNCDSLIRNLEGKED